jgi:hypothetical protein
MAEGDIDFFFISTAFFLNNAKTIYFLKSLWNITVHISNKKNILKIYQDYNIINIIYKKNPNEIIIIITKQSPT